MKAFFEEKQRFSQWWLWLILGSAALLVVGLFINGVYQQLVLGQPWGDSPMSDDSLVATTLLTITVILGTLLLFFNAALEITVDRGAVMYRFFPLIRQWRRLEREAIDRFEERRYYMGGYGIRQDLNGNRQLTVRGHDAVEITLLDGTKVLLGTQQPHELIDAIKKMKTGRD